MSQPPRKTYDLTEAEQRAKNQVSGRTVRQPGPAASGLDQQAHLGRQQADPVVIEGRRAAPADDRHGRYTVAVKTIDIFGNDTMTLVPVNVG